MKVRLLDLNSVSYLHSQTIYHAVAYCTTETSDGTIIILSPRDPYVSIGHHQLLEKEIDVEYCLKKRIPIIRREVGGGGVYLDKDQLFFQCIFPRGKAPIRVDHLYARFLQPAVNTYKSLGVDACYRPVNDIQVDEKKICGTGAGRIGEASVVVGNIMFDFNYREMSRALRLPSERLREKVYDSMQIYVTTLQRELGYRPEVERVKEILIQEFEKVLGSSLYKGILTPEENRMLGDVDKRFTDPQWLHEKGGKLNSWIKICTDVRVRESAHQSPGGLIRVILRLRGDSIDDIVISGDFTFQPSESLKHLEKQLVGQPLKIDPLVKAVETFYSIRGIQSPGIGPEDMVRAILGEKS
ncbi:MAG: lipoate--protein ligase family protein [Proteobacteria bacterium]|nr:lipoate--protein ligase family protein [Pseudomonadota bacterium]